MTRSTILQPAAGFMIAVGCALAPRPELPVPYFGIHPTNGSCVSGTIEGLCGNGLDTQCTVSFSGFTGIAAYDVRTGTVCSVPVYRAGLEDPDTLVSK